MSQRPTMSNLAGNALSILGTEPLNAKQAAFDAMKDTTIARPADRKRATASKMHCFEFRELLQAKRQKWMPQAHTSLGDNQELHAIEAALVRLSDGSYGTCSDCGGEIGRARLKTEPTAMRCHSCEVSRS